ncbi:Kinase-like protein [Pleurostoma richardsiae]|uniref:Kinase-like protein n=1 Tax=Pleurostoma richardsiae TaxID=41990 RepID=A0AA38REK9_9PEZI|nr:Kinase-like protein [Pleurostoma richardsiae]
MDKSQDAPDLVDKELTDRDLPLDCKITVNGIELSRRPQPHRPGKKAWRLAKSWDDRECDLFHSYQQYMLSPFFELKKDEVEFHDIDDETPLPFTEVAPCSKQGHHGRVFRVKIHPSHHGRSDNPSFAVKHILSVDGKDFKDEVKAWRKSGNTTRHPHLIDLLATCRKGPQDCYLLSDWAEGGNLRDYWFCHPNPQPDISLVRWIAQQSLGLAQALKQIHRSDSSLSDISERDYGIHSDIKPENMLLFKKPPGTPGTLVICDFGFTRFHSKESRSRAAHIGGTDTYRAPEAEFRPISRVYDVWALGCLFLEFITWYLTGYNGVQHDFTDRRIGGDTGQLMKTDKFFNNGPEGQAVKPCVREWIQHLRSLEHCRRIAAK